MKGLTSQKVPNKIGRALITLHDVGYFIMRFFKEAFLPPYEFKELLRQCYNIGYRSLLLISTTGLITGLVFTKQSRPSLADFGATSWLPSLVAIALLRTLAPLLTALIAAGKVGSSIGAELGSMRVTEQIDAMEVSATNPFKFLIGTRVLVKIIVLTAGTTKVPVIEANDQLIATTTLTTDEMMKTFQISNKNLVKITSDLKILSENLRAGKGTAGMLFTDEKLFENIQATVSNLKNTSVVSSKIAGDLKTFSSTLNNKEGLANKMFTDTIILPKLQASADKLQQLINSAAVQTDNLNKASSKLNDTNNPAGVLLNDRESAEHIKQILRNLESSSYNLDQDLKALQNNFLFRGYFRKQAKKAAENQ